MFNIIGAMAEFERELIRERVKAGLRNAKGKGKRLGRPRKNVDVVQICQLRSQGRSIRGIAADLGLSLGVVHGSLKQGS